MLDCMASIDQLYGSQEYARSTPTPSPSPTVPLPIHHHPSTVQSITRPSPPHPPPPTRFRHHKNHPSLAPTQDRASKVESRPDRPWWASLLIVLGSRYLVGWRGCDKRQDYVRAPRRRRSGGGDGLIDLLIYGEMGMGGDMKMEIGMGMRMRELDRYRYPCIPPSSIPRYDPCVRRGIASPSSSLPSSHPSPSGPTCLVLAWPDPACFD